MKKTIVIALFLTLNSCTLFKEKGIDFEIHNNSESAITEVKFYTTEKLDSVVFDKILSGKGVSGFLSMEDNKIDGAYVLEFKRENGEKATLSSGYYTNGATLDKAVLYNIKSDTILVTFNQ